MLQVVDVVPALQGISSNGGYALTGSRIADRCITIAPDLVVRQKPYTDSILDNPTPRRHSERPRNGAG